MLLVDRSSASGSGIPFRSASPMFRGVNSAKRRTGSQHRSEASASEGGDGDKFKSKKLSSNCDGRSSVSHRPQPQGSSANYHDPTESTSRALADEDHGHTVGHAGIAPAPTSSSSSRSSQPLVGEASRSVTQPLSSQLQTSQSTPHRPRRRPQNQVASACFNCKKDHLSCDPTRPCGRCRTTGKQDTCVDIQPKKRGRPRSRNDVGLESGASTKRQSAGRGAPAEQKLREIHPATPASMARPLAMIPASTGTELQRATNQSYTVPQRSYDSVLEPPLVSPGPGGTYQTNNTSPQSSRQSPSPISPQYPYPHRLSHAPTQSIAAPPLQVPYPYHSSSQSYMLSGLASSLPAISPGSSTSTSRAFHGAYFATIPESHATTQPPRSRARTTSSSSSTMNQHRTQPLSVAELAGESSNTPRARPTRLPPMTAPADSATYGPSSRVTDDPPAAPGFAQEVGPVKSTSRRTRASAENRRRSATASNATSKGDDDAELRRDRGQHRRHLRLSDVLEQ